jgi:AcrR family transcriptional regulator
MDAPRTVPRRSAGRRSAEPAQPADAERSALTREAWTDAATEVLVDQGIDHVRVDVLAKQLGVTRGSFYWHFRDREELLRSVLQAWRERATEQLTHRLEQAREDPRDQLSDVLSLPFRGRAAVRGARIELAIRAWARRDETARHAVDEADAQRIGYIAQIFSSLGYPIAEARQRAFIAYAHVVAESVMPNQGGSASRAERTRLFEALMLSPPLMGAGAPGGNSGLSG